MADAPSSSAELSPDQAAATMASKRYIVLLVVVSIARRAERVSDPTVTNTLSEVRMDAEPLDAAGRRGRG